MKSILVTGAASAIAQETLRLWAAEGTAFFLTDRDEVRLQAVARDLTVRGATAVHVKQQDLSQLSEPQSLWEEAVSALGEIDGIFIAHGTLPNQVVVQSDWQAAEHELRINCLSVIALLTVASEYFAGKQSGTIVVISSVAGDRGRQSNYVYGTAKGALTIYLQGLRNRLSKQGVQVLTVKPGFVDTPMTADFPKGILWVKPEVVARGIVRAVRKQKDVVYLPWFWRWIMLVIRLIPERFFKRLSL